MQTELLETLAYYRVVIGSLGERENFGWWQSSFFTQGADAFLSPLFARTQMLAQCNGVTQAAALVHDEHIGVGHVYHLFRLPEEIEQGIHQALHEPGLVQVLQKLVIAKDEALNFLRKQTYSKEITGVGPIRLGNIEALHDQTTWRLSAGHYLAGFEKGQMIFPYYSDIS